MTGQGKKECYSWKTLKMGEESPSETSVTANSLHEVMSKGCLYEAEKEMHVHNFEVRYKVRQIWREIFLNHKLLHTNDKIAITTRLKN